MLKLNKDKKFCPFLQEPFDDCYCTKMSSQDIERAVYLCSSNFELCEIFRNGNGSDNNKVSNSTLRSHKKAFKRIKKY